MSIITNTSALQSLCVRLTREDVVFIDTEFVRDATYWPITCLIQIGGADEVKIIDALAAGIDLSPLWNLLADKSILKVLHAGRQDMEIFLHMTGSMPAPVFDTQIAAQVCGFGEAPGFDKIVAKITGHGIDKHARMTDWQRRPLSKTQIEYALADVIHLRPVYAHLRDMLHKNKREHWMESEMSILTNPDTYRITPDEMWRRIKVRAPKPRMLAVLKEIAAWREIEAQTANVPRGRILRDEALVEIAAHPPNDMEKLENIRAISKGFGRSRRGRTLLEAIERGVAVPARNCPRPPIRSCRPEGLGPAVELLKVLLKTQCEAEGVAPKLIATSNDLEALAAEGAAADVPALAGWRKAVFGAAALDLLAGRLTLGLKDGRVILRAKRSNR
ncbi:MAG: ribonuclease D [Pseudomonadota bacterium]|nr:ribonuclease D [Pseudomonadota bacterium]